MTNKLRLEARSEGKMGVTAVDINCDMGEGFGSWRLGDTDDSSLFKFISSANIAAGFHGGDPNIMHRTIRLAVEHGVAVGVHPAFRDLQGFGRRRIDGTPEELVNDIAYQVGALGEFARWYGVPLQHVKPHGALFMELAVNEALSAAFIAYMRRVQPRAAIFCMGISVTYGLAKAAGHPVVREFYADRDYDERGSIVFTRHAGRLDPEAVARKVVRACREGRVATVSGNDIAIDFESVCFHSDTPGSLDIVQAIRAGLDAAGIEVAPVGRIMGF